LLGEGAGRGALKRNRKFGKRLLGDRKLGKRPVKKKGELICVSQQKAYGESNEHKFHGGNPSERGGRMVGKKARKTKGAKPPPSSKYLLGGLLHRYWKEKSVLGFGIPPNPKVRRRTEKKAVLNFDT